MRTTYEAVFAHGQRIKKNLESDASRLAQATAEVCTSVIANFFAADGHRDAVRKTINKKWILERIDTSIIDPRTSQELKGLLDKYCAVCQ